MEKTMYMQHVWSMGGLSSGSLGKMFPVRPDFKEKFLSVWLAQLYVQIYIFNVSGE